jgi:hypothetical protein
MASIITTSVGGRYEIVVGTKQEIINHLESNEINNIKVIQLIETSALNDVYTLFAVLN